MRQGLPDGRFPKGLLGTILFVHAGIPGFKAVDLEGLQ
jgi:hypothetical protein